MYNTGLPTPSQSVDARTPAIPGDFLGMLADFKVKADKDAAMRMLSAQAGQQQMPTVKDQIEQSNLMSARQEIAQKMGLPGLQQAAAQPAQPQGQAPQPQAMAGGGLTKLGSNLPKQYAGGGIVAFSGTEGSKVEDPSAARLIPAGVLAAVVAGKYALPELASIASGLGYASPEELLSAAASQAGTSVKNAASQAGTSVKNAVSSTMPKSALGKLGVAGALGGTAATVASTPTEAYRKRFGMETDDPSFLGDIGVRALGAASDLGDIATMGYASKYFRDKQEPDTPSASVKKEPRLVYDHPIAPEQPPKNAGLPAAAASASAAAKTRSRIATRGTAPSELPEGTTPAQAAPVDPNSLEAVIPAAAAKAATLDPEAGRQAIDTYYRNTVGSKVDAYEAAQRASLAKLKAEQEAERDSRDSGFIGGLKSLLQGVAMGHGNLGRSLAFSNIADEKRRKEYAATDQGYAKALMDAEAGIFKPGMEGAVAQFGAGNKDVESRRLLQSQGIKAGADILSNRETNKTHLATNAASNAAHIEAANIAAAASRYASDGRIEAALARQTDNSKKEEIRASQAALAQLPAMIKQAQNDFQGNPADLAKEIAQYKAQFVYHQQNLQRLTGIAAPVSATETNTGVPAVGEVRKGYTFKGGDPAKQENWVKN